MKRSEAIDIIDDVLIDHECPILSGIAKEILGRLEKAGMKPPRIKKKVSYEDPESKNDCYYTGNFNEWEPES